MSARVLRSTWTIPAAIALASVVGLVSALTGDGMRDFLSWVALAIPVAATIAAYRARA